MTLAAGTVLGAFEITGQLGAGGMGEVYRATDSQLKRDVAIKVLPQSLADDADRLARLRREAEVLAALNHPNIAHIYGLESIDSAVALVMELIDGPTLAERIAEGPIPLDESIDIAMQIAEALQAAHGRGIVHRDLKPANIKLRPDGLVKVLDFGIAKALDERAGTTGPRTPALTRTSMTRAGIVLGTAAYMSPEQARGRAVDQRTDVWAFGCILYEMLTGQPAFAGEDDTSTLARVLERDTDWRRLPRATLPQVRQALEYCLRKDPADRVADIRDVQLALRGKLRPPPVEQRRSRLVAVTAAIAVAAAGAAWLLKPGAPAADQTPAAVVRAGIDLVDGSRLIGFVDPLESGVGLARPSRPAMAYSPDGRFLVYAAGSAEGSRLYRHALDAGRPTPMPDTEGGYMPFFSPDGRSVGFFVGDALKRVEAASGSVRTVAIADSGLITEGFSTASWTGGDTIVLNGQDGIHEVSATGGAPVRLTTISPEQGERAHIYPQMLPGRRGLLYTSVTESAVPSDWNIVLDLLDGVDPRVLIEGASHAQYVSTGHIVFARAGQLLAVAFDIDTLQAGDTQAVVIEDVMHAEGGGNSGLNSGTAQVAISAAGALAYVQGGVYPTLGGRLAFVDLSGERTAIPLPEARYLWPRFSPGDGRYLAYAIGTFGDMRLWVYDMELEVPTPVTSGGESAEPVWSPDGTRIAFSRRDDEQQMYTIAADGGGEPEPVRSGIAGQPASWSPDNVLAYLSSPGPGEPRGIWTVRMDGDSEPRPFVGRDVGYPSFSPDGRLLAYSYSVDGRSEVFIRGYPDGGERRITSAGGTAPVWSADGATLYYRSFDAEAQEPLVMAQDMAAEAPFTRGRPRVLFRGQIGGTVPIRSYDIAPDGERFVTTVPPEERPEPQPVTRINLVLDWFDELERLVPTH